MKRRLKIAFFFDYGWKGGALRLVSDFSESLSRNHTVDIFTSTVTAGNEHFKTMQPPSCRVIPLKKIQIFLKKPWSSFSFGTLLINLWLLRLFYQNAAREMERGGYDLIFLDFGIDYRGHIPDIFHGLKTPVVYYCHEPIRKYYEKGFFYDESQKVRDVWWLKRMSDVLRQSFLDIYMKRNDAQCIRKATNVLCNSYYTREYIHKVWGIFARVSSPGVNPQKFRPLGLQRENLVLIVGELSERKGQDFAVRALSCIPQEKRPRLGLVYSADNLYKQWIEKLAAHSGVTVEMYPNLGDDEVIRMYNRSKLTLCAYLMEPFGIVPLESMACETPVVGIYEAGLRESIVNNETGILTERDPTEFGRAVESLLENENVRRRMGESGRQHILDHWTLEKMTERLEKHFFDIL